MIKLDFKTIHQFARQMKNKKTYDKNILLICFLMKARRPRNLP